MNPLRMDPTRTTHLRRHFVAELRAAFRKLRATLLRMLGEEDALGVNVRRPDKVLADLFLRRGFTPGTSQHEDATQMLRDAQMAGRLARTQAEVDAIVKEFEAGVSELASGRWAFLGGPEKVDEFKHWLAKEMDEKLDKDIDTLAKQFAERASKKGAERAYKDAGGKGEKAEFVDVLGRQPNVMETVGLLATRSASEIKGVTAEMQNKMVRTLADGLVQGKDAKAIAKDIVAVVDVSIGKAETFARTEVVRAHAEGQLLALEQMGVEEVGVAVEWTTAGDGRVCPKCKPLEGIVLKIAEARGMLPRHPN